MRSSEGPAAPAAPEPEKAVEPESDQEEQGGILGRTVGAILGVGPGRDEGAGEEDEAKPAEEPPQPDEKAEAAEEETQPEPEPEIDAADRIDLNRATFEHLRDVGFSVTQATRVITYRERQNGFKSLDDLADVPGMPRQFLREVKPKLTL
jgi:DNA uptake protein ComE-like DNA-binding protein